MNQKVVQTVLSLRKQGEAQEVIARKVNDLYGTNLDQRKVSELLIRHGMRSVKPYSKGFVQQELKVDQVTEVKVDPSLAMVETILESNLHDSAKVFILKTLTKQTQTQKGA